VTGKNDFSDLEAPAGQAQFDFSDLEAPKSAEPQVREIGPYEPAFTLKGLAKSALDFFSGKTDESEIAHAQNVYSAFKTDVATSLDKPVKNLQDKDLDDVSFLDFAHEVNRPMGEAMKNAYQVDRLNQKQGKLWFGAMFGDKTKLDSAKLIDSEIETEMQKHLDQYPEAKKFRQMNPLKHSLESAAGMASYMVNAQVSGLAGGALAGITTAAITRSPGMTAKAAQIGMLVGSGVYTAQIESGSIYGDLVKDHTIKDEKTGATKKVPGVDPDLAKVPALVGGTINAVIEVAQQALIMRLPISKGMSFAQKLEALQSNPFTKKILNTFLAKVVQDVPQEALEEATQAITSESLKNSAYALDAIIKKRQYMGTTAGEVFKQAGEEGKEAAYGLAALGLGTQSVKSGAGRVGRLLGKKPAITTAKAQDSVTVPPRETTPADTLNAAKQRLAKLKFELDPRPEMTGPGGVKIPEYGGRIGTIAELEEVKFLEANLDKPEEIAKKYNLKLVEHKPQTTPTIEGFRFKNGEDAKAYGKQIAGNGDKINELQEERNALIQQGKSEKDINQKYLILQKAQMLRDAIEEAGKAPVQPKVKAEKPVSPEAEQTVKDLETMIEDDDTDYGWDPETTPLAEQLAVELQRYEDPQEGEDITIGDLVANIEALEEQGTLSEELKSAIEDFRTAQEENDELSGRGDMDEAEEKFLAELKKEMESAPVEKTTEGKKDYFRKEGYVSPENFDEKNSVHMETLRRALESFEGGKKRFETLAKSGASDEALKANIGQAFGIEGGASGGEGYMENGHKGGANPQVFIGSHGRVKQKPTLQGKALIAATRTLYGIKKTEGGVVPKVDEDVDDDARDTMLQEGTPEEVAKDYINSHAHISVDGFDMYAENEDLEQGRGKDFVKKARAAVAQYIKDQGPEFQKDFGKQPPNKQLDKAGFETVYFDDKEWLLLGKSITKNGKQMVHLWPSDLPLFIDAGGTHREAADEHHKLSGLMTNESALSREKPAKLKPHSRRAERSEDEDEDTDGDEGGEPPVKPTKGPKAPKQAKTSEVVKTITGIEALINKKGNLTRGTDYIRETFLKGQTKENLEALKEWAANHKNPQVKRTVGHEVEALLRVEEKTKEPVATPSVEIFENKGMAYVVTGNPKINPIEKFGLKPGDKVVQVGVPAKSGKETLNARVTYWDVPITYLGTFDMGKDAEGEALIFETETQSGKKIYAAYPFVELKGEEPELIVHWKAKAGQSVRVYRAKFVKSEEGKTTPQGDVKKAEVPEAYRKVIEAEGGVVTGFTPGYKKKDGSMSAGLIQFSLPGETGKALPEDKFTPEAVREKLGKNTVKEYKAPIESKDFVKFFKEGLAKGMTRADARAYAEEKSLPEVIDVKATVTEAKQDIKEGVSESEASAKQIKNTLVAKLEEALKNAPRTVATAEEGPTEGAKGPATLEFSIPGDGTFKIVNTKEAIGKLLKYAKSISTASVEPSKMRIPDKTGRGKPISDVSAEGTNKASYKAEDEYLTVPKGFVTTGKFLAKMDKPVKGKFKPDDAGAGSAGRSEKALSAMLNQKAVGKLELVQFETGRSDMMDKGKLVQFDSGVSKEPIYTNVDAGKYEGMTKETNPIRAVFKRDDGSFVFANQNFVLFFMQNFKNPTYEVTAAESAVDSSGKRNKIHNGVILVNEGKKRVGVIMPLRDDETSGWAIGLKKEAVTKSKTLTKAETEKFQEAGFTYEKIVFQPVGGKKQTVVILNPKEKPTASGGSFVTGKQVDSEGGQTNTIQMIDSSAIISRTAMQMNKKYGTLEAAGEKFQEATLENGQPVLFQEAPDDMYSHAIQTAERKIANNATSVQIINTLKNNGVKTEEIDWMGLPQWLSGKDKVSKQELLDFMRENQVELKEVVRGKDSTISREEAEKILASGERVYLEGGGAITDLEKLRLVNEDAPLYRENGRNGTKFGNFMKPWTINDTYQERTLALPDNEAKYRNDQNEKYNALGKKVANRIVGEGESNRLGIQAGRINLYDLRDQGRLTEEEKTELSSIDSLDKNIEKSFKSSHFPEPNVVVNFMGQDEVIGQDKWFHIFEIQSDWHQKGREKGYRTESKGETEDSLHKKWKEASDNVLKRIKEMREKNTSEDDAVKDPEFLRLVDIENSADRALKEFKYPDTIKVPNAPFKKTWYELALKKILRMAVEGGYKGILLDTGDIVAERYDLSKQIETIRSERNNQGGYKLYIKYKELNGSMEQSSGENELPDYVGKEIAEQIVKSPRDTVVFAGLDLKVGGEFHRLYYDKKMPQFLSKYVKPWGAQLGKKAIHPGGKTSVEYIGPEYTKEDFASALLQMQHPDYNYENPFKLAPHIQPRAVLEGSIGDHMSVFRAMMAAMADTNEGGALSFSEAANLFVSPMTAELMGGYMDKLTAQWTLDLNALEFTDKMRDSVLSGQPMFQTEPSAKASTYEAEAKKLNDILEIHGIESVTIELADKIITPRGTKAFGAYDPATGRARIVTTPKTTTGYHEGFHIVLEKAFSQDRIQEALEEVKNDEIRTDAQAEEYLAEAFARYANKRNSAGLSDKVIAFFEDLLYFIKRMMGFSSKTEDLFSEMLHPDYYVPNAPVAHEAAFYQEHDDPEVNEERRAWKLSDRARAIVQKYAERIGEGYVQRGNLGIFYRKSQNIFVKALNDIQTVVHEVTHYLDQKHKLAEKVKNTTGRGDKVRKEITRIYVNLYGKGNAKHKLMKRITEGLAVLIENYAMNPEGIAIAYPTLVDLFIKPGGQYHVPEIAELVADTQALMAESRGVGALARLDSRVSNKKHKMAAITYFGFYDKFKNFLKDDLWMVEKLELMKGVIGKASPANWTRIMRNVGSMIFNNITTGKGFWSWRDGSYQKVLDFNWGDLIAKTQEAGTSKIFGNWLVARRQYFMWKNLGELPEQIAELEASLGDTETDAETQKEIDALRASAGKTAEVLAKDKFNRQDMEDVYVMFSEDFADEAAMFDALIKADLEMLADQEVMLITREQFEAMSRREGYATFHRDIYNDIIGEEGSQIGHVSGSSSKASFLKERYGSELDILNPLYGQLLNHAEALKKSLRQTVYNKLLRLAEATPELFQRQSLTVIPQDNGSVIMPQLTDPNFFIARADYKRVPVLCNREIKNLLDVSLDPQNVDSFARILLAVKRLFTVGTTSAFPPFALVNFGRDQVTASLLSVNTKFIPFYDSLNSLRQALLEQDTDESKFAEEYFALGGERQTLAGLFEKEPEEVLEIITKEVTGHKNIMEHLEKGMSLLTIPAKYSEYGTRLAEYILSRKKGKSQVEAMEDAGRVSGAFHHKGSFVEGRFKAQWLGTLWMMLPFANANLQVTWASLEKMFDANPKLRAKAWTVASVVTALTVSGLASVMIFGDDDDKEQYKNLKPEMLSRYIYFPNPFGAGLLSFPVPAELGTLGAVINAVIADKLLGTNYSAKEFMDIATAWIPNQFDVFHATRAFVSWFPQPLVPLASFIFNMKTFPEVEPIDRYPKYAGSEKYKRCSAVAIGIGKTLNVSPAKVDYLIQGYLTRTVRFIPGFHASDKGWLASSIDAFKRGVLSTYYFNSGRNVRDYYDIKERTMQDWSAFTNKERNFTAKEAKDLAWNRAILNKNKATGAPGLNMLFQKYRELSDGEASRDSERAKKLREVIIHKISLLRK
jgi:hypothetical protein